MTLNLNSFGNSFKFYLLNTICHKKGNNFGRPLEFRGHRHNFRTVHLWNIVPDNIFFKKKQGVLSLYKSNIKFTN